MLGKERKQSEKARHSTKCKQKGANQASRMTIISSPVMKYIFAEAGKVYQVETWKLFILKYVQRIKLFAYIIVLLLANTIKGKVQIKSSKLSINISIKELKFQL
jgi:hypothetical protein